LIELKIFAVTPEAWHPVCTPIKVDQLHTPFLKTLGGTMAVKTTTLQSGKIGVIEVKGSLVGGEETDELRNAVADFVEQGTKKLIIDLGKVTYLNSTAIGVLVSAHTTFSKNKGHVKLCEINKNINNIFVITKLTLVFDVAETREEAEKAFSAE
jgi:anti-sigma B factor antagonist